MSEPGTESAHRHRVGRLANELHDEGPVTVDLPTPGRVLAIGAHPDDIEFGCGATLAKWAADGCAVHHLVLTDGAKGSWDPGRDPVSLVASRQEEQREAARRVGGGDVAFLGRPDGELRSGISEQWEVCRWIRTVRPDVVLGHDPWRRYRLHPDHRNAGFIVTDALVAARDHHFFADQELEPHRPSALLLWEADSPNHVETATDYATTKLHALLAHRSQFVSTMGIAADATTHPEEADTERRAEIDAFERRVLVQMTAHGRVAGVPLGESFHLITDL